MSFPIQIHSHIGQTGLCFFLLVGEPFLRLGKKGKPEKGNNHFGV